MGKIQSISQASAAVLALFLGSVPAAGQELIAWPMGGVSWTRAILPGLPVRPLPRPLPPLPVPPRPAPSPTVPAPEVPAAPDAAPLSVSGYHVDGRITGTVAELTYVITFHNPTAGRLEGVLVQPIPADTVLSGFTMTAGGKTLKGELLEADQASTIYQNIVRQMRDPGLLELVGERMIRARVFPIEPQSDIVVRMTVSQVLKKSGELYGLSIPMRSATMSGSTTKGASVKLALSAQDPLGTVYSPLAGVEVIRRGEHAAEITFEAAQAAPADMNLFYSLRRNPLAAGLITYREKGEDGTFLLSLSPKRSAPEDRVAGKDILFVVDRSGSMEDGGKIGQAKAALAYCISKLGDSDRFGIVDFATGANLFESRLVVGTAANKARALRYVQRIEAAGGTNIEEALRQGLGLFRDGSDRVPMIFFMTDGLPTVGETRIENLMRLAEERNKAISARLFTFGVGDDVNTLFLDKLSESNRGARDYVRPGEDIEVKVSALYQKVANPALTDVQLSWDGVEVSELYPRPVADIFYGGELTLLGRFHGRGQGTLTVTGKASGKTVSFKYPVSFPEEEDANDFLPRLWANLKVSHELDAVRLSASPDPEVVKSIVAVAKRYGIVTPYTSYLITEEGERTANARQAGMRALGRMRSDAAASGFAAAPAVSLRAQKASALFLAAKGSTGFDGAPAAASEAAADMEKDARAELKKSGVAALATRSIGAKTFYLRRGVWEDGALSEAGPDAKTRTLGCLSPEYFQLIKEIPALAKYLSLGPRVRVFFGGVLYRVE